MWRPFYFGNLIVDPKNPDKVFTVRMTKNDQALSPKIEVKLDPRATYTIDDRRAQFALVGRLGALLDHMSMGGRRDRRGAR